ncbi:hypothetical protein STEG23_032346, partial [Scotinomys teguina]
SGEVLGKIQCHMRTCYLCAHMVLVLLKDEVHDDSSEQMTSKRSFYQGFIPNFPHKEPDKTV